MVYDYVQLSYILPTNQLGFNSMKQDSSCFCDCYRHDTTQTCIIMSHLERWRQIENPYNTGC